MRIRLPEKQIEVFTISPRTLEHRLYWQNILNVIQWSERYDCTGVLIFTGNDTYIDPWLVAQTVMAQTKTLEPLVAVNPIYMHPFTAAKMISSLAYLYKRKVWLNLVTGTALSYLDALSDKLTHQDRYQRLLEYALIIRKLLTSKGSVDFRGRFYKVSGLHLSSRLPESLLPGYFLAGQSEAAREVAGILNATNMQMLQPDFENPLYNAQGLHFGVVAREKENRAWMAAHDLFTLDSDGQKLLDLSMQNTDSVWKQRMKLLSESVEGNSNGYWLEPFRNFKADCPYLVGSYDKIANILAHFIRHGVDMFIIDLPASESEFYHLDATFKLTQQKL